MLGDQGACIATVVSFCTLNYFEISVLLVVCSISLFSSRIQQEYQTYYRKVGMRVSDILPGESGMRALMDACSGIRVSATTLYSYM